MKIYFAVSDIHSYIVPLIKDLKEAGFDKNNKDHILIVCGDIFDRGFDTLEVYKFLSSLPEDQLILVRGNHELLYQELLDKDFPEDHDFSNGTVRTFCTIAGFSEESLYNYFYLSAPNPLTAEEIQSSKRRSWEYIRDKVQKSEITKFIRSNRWKNFYELKDYIFVHSFIPLRLKNCTETKWMKHWPLYKIPENLLEPIPWWRTKALGYEWNDVTWGCPYKLFEAGLFDKEIKKGKTLVCGHWHAADFHRFFEGPEAATNNIFKGDHLIALDACTALSGQLNVLKIEPDSYKTIS